MRRMFGQSLSEILVALFFSSLITSMIGQSYVSIKKHYQWQERQLQVMQNNMLLKAWFKEKIHAAGQFGCNLQSHLTFSTLEDNPALAQAIWILPNTSTMLPQSVSRAAVNGASVLMLLQLVQPLNPIVYSQAFSEVIGVGLGSSLHIGDEVIISDCQHGFLAKVNSVSPSKKFISINKTLPETFQKNAVIAALEKNIIYLRKTKNGSALYVSDGKRSESLEEEVLGFQVSKKNNHGHSLLHIKIMRKKYAALDFYAAALGG